MNGAEVTGIILAKKYSLVLASTLFGATAHAVEEVRSKGWKGWALFFSDIVVCSFVGYVFFHVAELLYPSLAIVSCSIGSFWGTKGFSILRDWVITALQSNLDKLNG